LIGGGRDNNVTNNLFINCTQAEVYIDGRGLGLCGPTNNATLYLNLFAVPFTQPPWSTEYPKLASILSGDPNEPDGNVFATNLFYPLVVGAPLVSHCPPDISNFTQITNSIGRTWKASEFVDSPNKNFQLVPNHPAYALGFQRIPFENIGITSGVTVGVIIAPTCPLVPCPNNSHCVANTCVCDTGYNVLGTDCVSDTVTSIGFNLSSGLTIWVVALLIVLVVTSRQ
jgi:hypothetical protein